MLMSLVIHTFFCIDKRHFSLIVIHQFIKLSLLRVVVLIKIDITKEEDRSKGMGVIGGAFGYVEIHKIKK